MKLKDAKVHIIGGTGQMGSWLKKFLESQKISATVSNSSNKAPDLIKEADIVFISVPINVAVTVINNTAKIVSDKTILIDLSSIKVEICKALKETKLTSLGIHLLFGPTVSTIQNQKMAYVPVKTNQLSKELIALFKKAGAQIIEMTASEHDYQMAHIQALTHFMNFSLAKVLSEDKISLNGQVSTPVFLAQMSATSRVISQPSSLITQIQIKNPNFLTVVKKLQKYQELLINLIEEKNDKKLGGLYDEIKTYLDSSMDGSKPNRISKQKLKKLQIKEKVKIAYLGPEGTFSHQAARQMVTGRASLVACKTIYDIFNTVSTSEADFGLVPAENSIEGTIRETLDFLVDFDLRVNLEVALEVHQNLLSKENNLGKIRRVISHPQALAQSRQWLEKNLPEANLEYSSSTISAVNQTNEKGVAVIGSILAAQIYKLNTLAKNIETKDLNITKFYLVSKDLLSLKKRATKTLLFLTVFNRVGILKDILSVFADFDINLNKLESRPSKEKNWDYYFYVEVESALDEPRLIQALNILKQFCPVIKVLGEM